MTTNEQEEFVEKMATDEHEEFIKKLFSETFGSEPDDATAQILYEAYNENGFKPDFGLDQGYLHIGGLTEENLENNGPSSAKMLDLARVILCSYALSMIFDKSELRKMAVKRLSDIVSELSMIAPDTDGNPSKEWLDDVYLRNNLLDMRLRMIRERDDWRHWPETIPQECVLMEIRLDGDDETYGFLFFHDNTWYVAEGCACLSLSDEKFRYRLATVFFKEQREKEKQEHIKSTRYNPYSWNDFPEVTPPYNAIMRLEFEDATTNRKYYYAAFYTSEGWRQAVENGFERFVLHKGMIEAGLIKNARFHIWDY